MNALVCIDYINDIMDANGKLASKGYPGFAERHGVLAQVAAAQQAFRDAGQPVIHVRVGFDRTYLAQPKRSPLFGRANEFQALQLGAWGTEFVAEVAPIGDEIVIHKPRVSAFFGTSLEATLRALDIGTVYIAGVATDLAVSSAARDAHDRDFQVVTLADACAAADEADHEAALKAIGKMSRVAETLDVEL